MKVNSLFQWFSSALIVIAIVFGFLATPAFADVEFSAPNAATTHNNYFILSREIGVVYSDDNRGRRVLMCNSAYGQPVIGSEWQSTCKTTETLLASTKLRVQAYYKQTSPNPNIRWRCAIPSYTPTEGGFTVNWKSECGILLAKTIISGLNVTNRGIDVCQDNGLNVNPPTFNN